jgi:hypothetical protein
LVSVIGFGQTKSDPVQGKVTYVTPSNVYVRFSTTERISIGDTLQLLGEGGKQNCLVVTNMSSSSCVCTILSGCEVKKDDAIVFVPKPTIKELEEMEQKPVVLEEKESKPESRWKNVHGKFTLAGLSNASNIRDDSYRMNYGFSVNAKHINQSKFSVESYVNYAQYFNQVAENPTQKRDFLNVYNLSVRYDLDSLSSITVGRKINNKISSVGAIDGLQGEKYLGHFYVGALVGFRPDIYTFSINTNNFQFGGYAGFFTHKNKTHTQTTVGYFSQFVSGNSDRKFLFVQHQSNLGRKIRLFGSADLDVYTNSISTGLQSPRLTNLYLSANYLINKMFSLQVSYNSRKQVLYAETYPMVIEQIQALDDARQGIRARLNVRLNSHFNFGVSYSNRFQKSALNTSDNYQGYFNWNSLPKIGGRLALNGNINVSNFMQTNSASIRYSRGLLKQKLQADVYYRYINYEYLSYVLTRNQHYWGTNLAYRFTKLLTASILGEISTRPEEKNYRVYVKIIQRF